MDPQNASPFNLAPSPILIGTTLLAASILATALYRLFFHPLAGVPGPKLAAVSKLWLAWHTRKAKNHVFLPTLHERYGKVVRIAPSWVLIRDEGFMKEAYGAGSAFTKGGWYQVCTAPDSKYKGEDRFDLLTDMNKERTRRQKRAIGPAYSIAGIEKHEELITSYISTFTTRLRTLDSTLVDLQTWIHIFALDLLSNLTFSKSNDYTAQGHDGNNMAASDDHWAYFTVVGIFPGLVNLTQTFPKLYTYITPLVARAFGLPVAAGLPIFRFAVPNVLERLKALDTTSKVAMPMDRPGLVTSVADDISTATPASQVEETQSEPDLLASLMALHTNKQTTFHPAWVLGMAMTNFGAGHDTLTVALSGLIYCLATHPEAQARLVRELKDAYITLETPYTTIITRVPYILAVFKESLRLYPALAFMLPRVVPATGYAVNGHYFPPGTTVAASMYAAHHDPAIYSSPHEFLPSRWMQDGSDTQKAHISRLEGVWLGFGGGSNSCPGQHLARFCVVKCVVALLLDFEVEVEGEPRIKGWFSAHLGGVGVRFRPRG